jgi:hypothetical protein
LKLLDDYESYNPCVLEFVKEYSGRTGQQIREDAAWQNAAAKKPKHLDQMSAMEMDAFKQMLDAKFPLNAELFSLRVKVASKHAIPPSHC